MKSKKIIEKNYFWYLVLLGTVAIFGICKYFSTIKKTNGLFVFPTDDTYITLSYSVQMGKGFAFKFNDSDPPNPTEPSFLSQAIYSVSYKMGLRSVHALSSFVFWLNMCLLFFTLIVVFYIFEQCTGNTFLSIISIMMLFLYTPFRYIFVLGMGHSWLTFLFYLSILFLMKDNVFLYAILVSFLALSRPESIFILLVFLFYNIYAKKYKFLKYTILGIIIWIGLAFFYFTLSGKFLPGGFYPQSLWVYYSKGAIMGHVTDYIIEYIKGIFMGMYPSSVSRWYIDFYYSSLPLGLFLFFIIGFFYKPFSPFLKRFVLILLPVFTISLVLSGFTLYRGVHLIRHTTWTFPIIFLFATLGIEFIYKKVKNILLRYGLYSFYFIYLLGITIDFESKNVSLSIHKSYSHYEAAKWIKRNIKNGEFLAITPSRLKFFSGVKIYPFSPGTNWRVSRFSSTYYPSHYFEFLKYEIKPDSNYFGYWDIYDEEIPLFRYFKFLMDKVIYEQRFLSGTYIKIARVDVDKILNAEKIYVLDRCKIIDHVDICDPLSEKKHGYSFYFYEPLIKLRPFPIIGEINDHKFIEGGISSVIEEFNFYLNNSQNQDSIFLIGRLAKKVFYSIVFHKKIFSNFIELPSQKIAIYINDKFLTTLIFQNVRNFTEFKVHLPLKYLKPHRNKIIISGPHISTSYWIAAKKSS